VLCLDIGIVFSQRHALCIAQGLLEFCRQFFESHQKLPSNKITLCLQYSRMPHTLPDQKVQPSDTAYAGRFQRHKTWYVFSHS
jgi:hypothetical protein